MDIVVTSIINPPLYLVNIRNLLHWYDLWYEWTENHHFTITTHTSQHVEFFHSLIFFYRLYANTSWSWIRQKELRTVLIHIFIFWTSTFATNKTLSFEEHHGTDSILHVMPIFFKKMDIVKKLVGTLAEQNNVSACSISSWIVLPRHNDSFRQTLNGTGTRKKELHYFMFSLHIAELHCGTTTLW